MFISIPSGNKYDYSLLFPNRINIGSNISGNGKTKRTIVFAIPVQILSCVFLIFILDFVTRQSLHISSLVQ